MAHLLDNAESLLKNAHAQQRLAHAFLVSGPRGSGKEELVCRIAEMLNGRRGKDLTTSESDLLRVVRPVGKSQRITVADMRAMEKELHDKVGTADWKVGVVWDAHRLNASSENAFLKTLEEPPPQTVLFLLTDQPSALLPTIHSRCVHLELMPSPGAAELDANGQALVELVKAHFSNGLGNEAKALGFCGSLSLLLKSIRDDFEKQATQVFKKDDKYYRERADAPTWLRKRKEALEADAVGAYLASRSLMIRLLVAWFGDALRLGGGGATLEVPDLESQSRIIAQGESVASLLRRMEALETMRHELETNASEALVMEVGCLRAFVA